MRASNPRFPNGWDILSNINNVRPLSTALANTFWVAERSWVWVVLMVMVAASVDFCPFLTSGGDPTYQGAGLLFDKGYAAFPAGVHGLKRSVGRAPPTIGG